MVKKLLYLDILINHYSVVNLRWYCFDVVVASGRTEIIRWNVVKEMYRKRCSNDVFSIWSD